MRIKEVIDNLISLIVERILLVSTIMKCIEKSMENIITSVRVDRVKEFSSGESMKFLFVLLLH